MKKFVKSVVLISLVVIGVCSIDWQELQQNSLSNRLSTQIKEIRDNNNKELSIQIEEIKANNK